MAQSKQHQEQTVNSIDAARAHVADIGRQAFAALNRDETLTAWRWARRAAFEFEMTVDLSDREIEEAIGRVRTIMDRAETDATTRQSLGKAIESLEHHRLDLAADARCAASLVAECEVQCVRRGAPSHRVASDPVDDPAWATKIHDPAPVSEFLERDAWALLALENQRLRVEAEQWRTSPAATDTTIERLKRVLVEARDLGVSVPGFPPLGDLLGLVDARIADAAKDNGAPNEAA